MLNDYFAIKTVHLKHNSALPLSPPVERLFRLAGHIHAPKRCSLSDDMFSCLVFLNGVLSSLLLGVLSFKLKYLLQKLVATMHFIGRVTMLFANNSLMECLITMKFLHIFFTP